MEEIMKRNFGIVCLLALTLGITSCSKKNANTLGNDELRDKIAGGWAGKMIGVAYGGPKEFRAKGETYEKEIEWKPSFVAQSLRQDDIYVQLSFMMAMDKYGIDDAVADGATVPIHYTSRKTEWQIDTARLDVLFDQWFAGESEERIAEIKKRGISIADLAKHAKRVELIAYDMWEHSHVQRAKEMRHWMGSSDFIIN